MCERQYKLLLFALGLLVLTTPAQAQLGREANHPELTWETLETEHFKIHYHQGLERFAGRASRAAEEVFGPITRLYGFVPDKKIRLVLKDVDDIGFGVAIPPFNMLEIWASSINIDFEFRGTKTDWLRNVFTHELTHLISLQTARKGTRRLPALVFQFLGYQSEGRRDDVLTGYPDILAAYAVPTTIVPPWYAEGTAQYMAAGAHYDRWDSHRDMILRMATLNDALLTYDEMNAFGAKTGLGFEKVYDHGYALVLFIVNTFGEENLARIYKNMTTWWRTDFGGAVQEALGISGRELHRRWVASLKERYRMQEAQIGADPAAGEVVHAEGYLNLYPRWSPNGKRLAYLSNAGSDYGRTGLYAFTFADSTQELVAPGARTAFDWSPDGVHLLFARRSPPNRYGCRFWDLYTANPSHPDKKSAFQKAAGILGLSGEKRPGETRLSHSLRAVFPAYAPDATAIAFVKNRGGSTNLGIMDTSTREVRYLTQFDDGTLVYTPRWSPDGKRIAFSIFRPDGSRDIAVIPAEGGDWTCVVASSGTDRDPCWTPDGAGLVFASDREGIFDLYHLDLTDGAVHRITRVPGGALQPHVHPHDGRIAFTYYGAKGYEIRTIDGRSLWESVDLLAFHPRGTAPPLPRLAEVEQPESRPYKNDFTPLIVLPRIAIDAGKLKLGFETGSDDVLGKQGLFFVGMMSLDRDVDLFSLYESRHWRPTLFLEAYRVTRNVEEDVVDRDRDFRIFNRTFALNGIELGAKYRMGRGGLLDARLIYSRYGWIVDQARFNGLNRTTLGATYFNGFDLAFSYRLKSVARARDSEINPRAGRQITFRYDRFFNFFLRGFKENTSVLVEIYDNYFYNQFTLDWSEFLPVGPGRSALGFRFYGGLIDSAVDDFFDFHLGGLPYLKGYTFYSLEGSRAAMFRAAYRFPIRTRINRQTGPVYSDHLYGSIYAGIGRAWDGTASDSTLKRGWKRDVGAQLRYGGTSFYVFPTRISFNIAYGFDTAPLLSPTDPSRRSGLKFYFTLLFGYLQSVGL